jgi:hypothetical protein
VWVSGLAQIRKLRVEEFSLARQQIKLHGIVRRPVFRAWRQGSERKIANEQCLAVVVVRRSVPGLQKAMDASTRGKAAILLF